MLVFGTDTECSSLEVRASSPTIRIVCMEKWSSVIHTIHSRLPTLKERFESTAHTQRVCVIILRNETWVEMFHFYNYCSADRTVMWTQNKFFIFKKFQSKRKNWIISYLQHYSSSTTCVTLILCDNYSNNDCQHFIPSKE